LADKAPEKKSARREKLRERLLAEAEKAIASGGLQGLKAREIASAAGCALGAIYNAFDDLDDLILRVGARTLALLETTLNGELKEGGGDATESLVRLALGYLDFARNHKLRWRALFEHRLADAHAVPAWFVAEQNRLFLLLEEPLGRLLPQEPPRERAALARSLFSAVHGIVTLGLEEKIAPMPARALEEQVEKMTRIFAAGLIAKR
jgi:AcrR family transcriptional regulator